MKLTHKQEWLVSRYVRAVSDELGDVPDATRDQAVAHVRAHAYRELRALGQESVQDADVTAMLNRLGPPAHQAEAFLHERGHSPGLALSADDRVWLGVCGGLAAHFGLSSTLVRSLTVLFGITGPLAVVAYLVLYFEMYIGNRAARQAKEIPQIDSARVVLSLGGTLFAAVAVHVGGLLVLRVITEVYLRLMQKDALPDLGGWEWLEINAGFMLFCVLCIGLPLALLSALPLAHQWDETIKRAVQAFLAVYALGVCFGIASYAVGIIVLVVEDFSGG
jgi:phage shock protein PspC (stress-responsive transcriptional regulator)